MSETKPHEAPKRRRNIQSLVERAALRRDWDAGVNAPTLARRYDVGVATIYQRRDREKWVRPPPPLPPEPAGPAPTDSLGIARAALARASEALVAGRAADALILIKAGDAVGAFADFVAELELRPRALPDAGEPPQSRPEPQP